MTVPMAAGDVIVMGSDGLWDNVGDGEILAEVWLNIIIIFGLFFFASAASEGRQCLPPNLTHPPLLSPGTPTPSPAAVLPAGGGGAGGEEESRVAGEAPGAQEALVIEQRCSANEKSREESRAKKRRRTPRGWRGEPRSRLPRTI